MRMRKATWAVVLLGILVAACGSDGPTGASAGISPTIRGRFVGGAFAGAPEVSRASVVAAEDIIVRVQEDPAVQVKVGSDGTFTLRGLPAGGFTLLFTQGGTVIGQQTFTEVQPNHEITIQVELVEGEVVVVDESRTGIGHGDIEIEGEIEKITTGSNGEVKLLIDGKTVIFKPGETAIRDEDNQAVLVADLEEGMQVHVKGVWVEGSATDVIAHSIVVQEGDDDDDDGDVGEGGKATICHIPPGNPANQKTLSVGTSAVPAHMAHGDKMGACSGSGEPKNKGPEKDKKGKPENKGGGKK